MHPYSNAPFFISRVGMYRGRDLRWVLNGEGDSTIGKDGWRERGEKRRVSLQGVLLTLRTLVMVLLTH